MSNAFTTTRILLHLDGSNNGTTFTEETGRTVTAHGTAKTSTAQAQFGGASARFDGSGWLTVDATGIALNADFTAGGWVYITDLGFYHGVFEGRAIANYNMLFGVFNVGGTLRIDQVNDGGAGTRLTGTSTSIPLNTWTYLEWARSQGTLMAFVGGVKDTTTKSYTAPIAAIASELSIGRIADPYYAYAYYDNLFIEDGIARHVADFTPPTAPATIPTYSHPGTGLILPRHHPDYNGIDTLTGTTRVQTGPTTFEIIGNCKLILMDQKTLRPVAETTSDASGNFAFTGINLARAYFLNTFDSSGTYDVTATENLG